MSRRFQLPTLMTLPDGRLAARPASKGSRHAPDASAQANLIDGLSFDMQPGSDILIEDGTIREVAQRPIASPSAAVLDLQGRTLVPGLIDCHVHVIAASANLALGAPIRGSDLRECLA